MAKAKYSGMKFAITADEPITMEELMTLPYSDLIELVERKKYLIGKEVIANLLVGKTF